jgi:hypothetical protein
MFGDDENGGRRKDEKYRTEAARIAETRPPCDYCGDDAQPTFLVRIEVYDLRGDLMTGKHICNICIPEQGFTGWDYTGGGWPTRDPLGRESPPERETEAPMHWREIGEALEGRVPAVS